MTWKPTHGLKMADHIVRGLELEAAEAASVITPLFAHRMKQVIAEALDTSMPASVRAALGEAPDADQGYMESLVNGRHDPADDFPAMYADEPSAGTAPVAVVSETVSAKPERRGRGRPKGSKGKQKKAKAPEKVAEASAQETTG